MARATAIDADMQAARERLSVALRLIDYTHALTFQKRLDRLEGEARLLRRRPRTRRPRHQAPEAIDRAPRLREKSPLTICAPGSFGIGSSLGGWRVEKMNEDGGYECVEVFAGPNARERAIDQLRMLAVNGKNLKTVAEGTVGRWSQGIAFSRDGRVVMIESMIDRGLNTFHWDGATLTPGATIDVKGGAAAIGTSWP